MPHTRSFTVLFCRSISPTCLLSEHMLRLILFLSRSPRRGSNSPSMCIALILKPLEVYNRATFNILVSNVGDFVFPTISTVVNLMCREVLIKNLIRFTDIMSAARITSRYLISISCGSLIRFPRTWIDCFLVVFPFRHCRLLPKMSLAASTSSIVRTVWQLIVSNDSTEVLVTHATQYVL